MSDVTMLATGPGFPEGPVVCHDGSVVLTEIRHGRCTRVTPDGSISVFSHTGGGPNGLAIGPDGAFYLCNNGASRYVEGTSMGQGPHPDYTCGSKGELAEPSLSELARVIQAGACIEESFKRGKSEVGMDEYQVRTWEGWHHHMALSLVAVWFLIGETHRGQQWTPALTLPQVRYGLSLLLLEVFYTPGIDSIDLQKMNWKFTDSPGFSGKITIP